MFKKTTWTVGLLVLLTAAMAVPAMAQTAPQKPPSPVSEQPKGKSFSAPENAAAALYAAARRNDEAELLVIFGPGGKEIIEWSDDPNERQAEREHFAGKYDQMHRLVNEPDGTVQLYVGAENWPMPIPLVHYNGAWYFDVELGKMEIRYRRVGRNEMEALETCHALVDAEKDYSADAHHYTDRFISTGDSHDGLYWKSADPMKNSPIGPYLAHAGANASNDGSNRDARTPFHGYYYRILLTPKASAGGFAIVAFPADYRASGVMTFLMDAEGNAREKDLGQDTVTAAGQITSYNPDDSWKKVE